VSTHERFLFDVECQRDFFHPAGSCYSPAAGAAARRIYRLFHWVEANGIPVISSVLRIRRHEQGPLAPVPHCVEGTDGEQKLERTILASCINLGLRNSTDLRIDLFDHYQQVIFEKRDTNIMIHARAERLFTELQPATFILCGAGVARSILQAAVGLRSRGFGVVLAVDAVADVGDARAEMAYRCMQAKGVIFARTSQIVTAQPLPTAPRGRRTAVSAG